MRVALALFALLLYEGAPCEAVKLVRLGPAFAQETTHVHLVVDLDTAHASHDKMQHLVQSYDDYLGTLPLNRSARGLNEHLRQCGMHLLSVERLVGRPMTNARDRRFDLMGLLGLGAAAIEEVQILDLQADMRKQDEVNHELFVVLGKRGAAIHKLKDDIGLLNRTLATAITTLDHLELEVHVEHLDAVMHRAVTRHCQQIAVFADGISALVEGRLDTHLVDPAAIFSALRTIARDHKRRGVPLSVTTLTELLQQPFSLVRRGHQLHLYVHVAATGDQLGSLFRVFPSHVAVDDYHVTVSDPMERDFILLTEDREFFSDVKDQCTPGKGQFFICTQTMLTEVDTSSCFMRSFGSNSTVGISNSTVGCATRVSKKATSAYLLDSNTLFIGAGNVEQHCGNETTMLSGPIVKFDHTCEIVIPEAKAKVPKRGPILKAVNAISSIDVFDSDVKVEHFPLLKDQNLTNLLSDLGHIELPEPVSLDHLEKAIKEKQSTSLLLYITIGLAIVTGVCLLVLCVILRHLWKKHFQTQKS